MSANTGPQKVLIVFPFLGPGGIERVLVGLLKHLDRRKFQPVLVVDQESPDHPWAIPPDVKILPLVKPASSKLAHRLRFPWRLYALSRIFKRENPALIMSVIIHANYLASLARLLSGRDIPLILSEHIHVQAVLGREEWGKVKGTIIRWTYPRATKILCVSQGIKDELVATFRVPPEKCAVIYNPCDLETIAELAREEVEHPWFHQDTPLVVGCGGLREQKNFPLLLRAVKQVAESGPVRLVILGEGADRPQLEAYARELGISSQVAFLGFRQNPFKYMARAQVFVLSSSWEGFPMVLLEAMACGVPVVSTRCPHGPEEIITDGENGLLVPVNDAGALAEGIGRLLREGALRQRLGAAGRQRAEDFRAERIIKTYEGLFEQCLAG